MAHSEAAAGHEVVVSLEELARRDLARMSYQAYPAGDGVDVFFVWDDEACTADFVGRYPSLFAAARFLQAAGWPKEEL